MERVSARGPVRRRARSAHAGRSRGRGVALAPRERRRLLQLGVCVALFLAVFVGRGVFPEQMEAVRGELLEVIRSDTDFRTAFDRLGRAVEEGVPAGEALSGLWTDVFSPAGGGTVYVLPEEGTPLYQAERAFLSTGPGLEQAMERRLTQPERQETVPESVEEAPSQAADPAEEGADSGLPAPDNATLEEVPINLEETTAPVMAVVSSPFGWREHPIEGGEKFHNGVDLAAPYGDPIGSFADGVVDYIGESPSYGQYIQVKHDGGVTSFYAHCSRLLAQPGQQVKAGETIAEVGDTGEVTGAHLHFELRVDGVLVDPLDYITVLESE